VNISHRKLNEILEKIRHSSQAVKIVLFGSRAWGTPGEDSDIDVLVIEKYFADKRAEMVRIKSGLISSEYSLDILLFTYDEYHKKLREGWSLLEMIEKHGKVFYAAS
jgi:predicted nucleotidyltransferase